MDIKSRSTNTTTRTRINTTNNPLTTIRTSPITWTWLRSLNYFAKIASSNNNQSNNNHQERPHHNEVTDLTNIPISPEIDDNPENPYTVRRDRPEKRELLRARRRSSLSFPTQESTLVSYGSTDIESNIIRPIDVVNSEPPCRTGTPSLHIFSFCSPSDHSGNSTI